MKRFLVDIVKACRDHDILNLAANISFFAILSLLPLSMIFASVLGFVVGSETIVTQIAESITDVVPGVHDIFLANVGNLVKKKSALGIWGVGFLVFASTVLFSSLEGAFNKIFRVTQKRGFFRSRLISVGVIAIILLLLFLPFTLRALEAFLVEYGYSIPLYSYISGKIFFIIFAILSFTVTLIIVPKQRVYIRNALLGGLLYAASITAAKFFFAWYLSVVFDRYNLVYGSLTALILTFIWIYYLATILLVSAEVVAFLQRRVTDGDK